MLKIIIKIYIIVYIHNYFLIVVQCIHVFKIHYMMYWLLHR